MDECPVFLTCTDFRMEHGSVEMQRVPLLKASLDLIARFIALQQSGHRSSGNLAVNRAGLRYKAQLGRSANKSAAVGFISRERRPLRCPGGAQAAAGKRPRAVWSAGAVCVAPRVAAHCDKLAVINVQRQLVFDSDFIVKLKSGARSVIGDVVQPGSLTRSATFISQKHWIYSRRARLPSSLHNCIPAVPEQLCSPRCDGWIRFQGGNWLFSPK
ncbi:hypothetical protein AOLI_G00176850 [Acnodon oligacanthus]